jgi:protein gp37
MAHSSIEWTEATWNPTTGCTKASAGCKNCYAITMSRRLQAMERAQGITDGKYRNGFKLTLHEDEIERPLAWKKPLVIFVNSMSDLFHEKVPLEFIERVFDTMNRAHWHTFQVLTKRPQLVARYDPFLQWAPNIWMGTSVEDAAVRWRVRDLALCSARVKFLSCEPLIGPLGALPLKGKIDWVIAGGESGHGARPMRAEWLRALRDQCVAKDVPFFFKQTGSVLAKFWNCRDAKGTIPEDWPRDLRLRQMPGSVK